MGSGVLWGLVPDEAMSLVLIGAGLLCMIVGRGAVGFLRPLGVMLLISPFITSLLGALPFWLVVCIMVLVGLAFVRAVLGLLLGRGASNHVVGSLAADGIRWGLGLLFAIPILFLRLVRHGLAGAGRPGVRR